MFFLSRCWDAPRSFCGPLDLDAAPSRRAGGRAGRRGVVLFEIRIREVSLKRLIGAAFGSVLGILGAYLISLVLEQRHARHHNHGSVSSKWRCWPG